MKILAIHSHPDDVEFLCAGTLVLLQQQGHQIAIASMTPGDKGTPDKAICEISAIRREEARRSASLIGASYTCLEFLDFELFDDDRSRRIVTEFMRKTQPDIVLAASPTDYMADHEAASVLARNATFVAGVRNYQTGEALPLNRIPALYYMDPLEGTDHFGNALQPDFCVDISSTMTMKESMLASHESQREWLRKHHGVDRYIEAMKEWASTRGKMAGVPYAEGFRQHIGHAYPKENILADLLPGCIYVQSKNVTKD